MAQTGGPTSRGKRAIALRVTMRFFPSFPTVSVCMSVKVKSMGHIPKVGLFMWANGGQKESRQEIVRVLHRASNRKDDIDPDAISR